LRSFSNQTTCILSTGLFGSQDGRGDVCAKDEMKKRKDPPGYPGDEAILKAVGDALRNVRIEKGLSLEQADAAFQESLKQDLYPRLPRALGIVVRRLREKQNMSRMQLSDASGLSARFLSTLERGKATNASLTQIVRISFGLNYPIIDLVNEVVAMEEKLRSE
jgi:Helix-turn-helix domain